MTHLVSELVVVDPVEVFEHQVDLLVGEDPHVFEHLAEGFAGESGFGGGFDLGVFQFEPGFGFFAEGFAVFGGAVAVFEEGVGGVLLGFVEVAYRVDQVEYGVDLGAELVREFLEGFGGGVDFGRLVGWTL